MEELKLFCPVLKAKININCATLDDVGQFTKFILWAIGNGYNLSEIDRVIELGEYVVLEEVIYLCKIGFVIENNNTYSLSENGVTYLRLIDTLENVNSLDILVHINCFTGEVQKFNEHNYDKNSLNEEIQKLPEIVSRKFFFNKNYANSREFLFENYSELFQDLSETHKESIYIEIESDKETKYIIYELNQVPSADFDYSNETIIGPTLLFKRPIKKFSYSMKDERLENYRNVLSTLAMLEKFDEELLSYKSHNLILMEDEEKKINKGNTVIFVDAFKGEIVTSVTNNYIKQRKTIIQLPEYQYDISEEIVREQLEVDNNHYIISEPTIETTTVFQLAPFNLFIEKKENADEECSCF
ncbi:hypothetical protein ACPUYX_11200 [Desulfosporosinus sp. SYSU MS00001]|uniref:hypothetical protein n=1 Tax=Desulfosporosinus sp. SYSU MS00001 TaxID=3416284 RepID=UPI003CEC9C5F